MKSYSTYLLIPFGIAHLPAILLTYTHLGSETGANFQILHHDLRKHLQILKQVIDTSFS